MLKDFLFVADINFLLEIVGLRHKNTDGLDQANSLSIQFHAVDN